MTSCEFYDASNPTPVLANYDRQCVPRIGDDVTIRCFDGQIRDCRVVAVRHLMTNTVFESARLAVVVHSIVKETT